MWNSGNKRSRAFRILECFDVLELHVSVWHASGVRHLRYKMWSSVRMDICARLCSPIDLEDMHGMAQSSNFNSIHDVARMWFGDLS